MKKMMILLMTMCLTALATEAQVMTSETVTKVYEKAKTARGGEFAYNAAYDDEGRIVATDVYRKRPLRKGDVRLVPTCRYEYAYAADGLLSSRVMYVWRSDEWRLAGRHDYRLAEATYTVTYSRWNRKAGAYDQPLGMMTYSLLPDESVYSVACYYRHHREGAMELEWQTPVEPQAAGADYYLTKK